MTQVGEGWRYGNQDVPDEKNPWFMALLMASIFGMLLRVFILNWDLELVLHYFGSDDLFYYTQVAHHWLRQGFPSFDGEHVTTGVQPLFTWCLMPFSPFFDGNPQFALRVSLGLSSLFTLVLAWQLPGTMRSLFGNFWGTRIGTLAGVIWLLHPNLLDVTFKGTEAALAALCWLWSIRAWSRYNGSPASSLKLGFFLGLGCLARIDHLALAVCLICLDSKPVPAPWERRFLLKVTGLTLTFLPWLLYCQSITGTPLQDSGQAKQLHYNYIGKMQTALQEDQPGAQPDASSAKSPAKINTLRRWLAIYLPLVSNGGELSFVSMLGWCCFFIYTLITLFLRPPHLREIQRGMRYSDRIVEAAFAIIVFYGVFFGYLRPWYYIPALLMISLLAAITWVEFAVPRWRGRKIHNLTAIICCWMSLAALEWHDRDRFAWEPYYARAAVALQAMTPVDARIGAFNAGIQGAFASRRRVVVNLDGVVNHGALQALQDEYLVDYLEAQRIEYLIDHKGSVDFFGAMGGAGLKDRLELMSTLDVPERPEQSLCLWRVRHPQKALKESNHSRPEP